MANPLLSLLDVFSILCCVLSSVSAIAFFKNRPQTQTPLSQPKLKPIGQWAALGDSYAAGIGAGKRLPGWSSYGCSRYNSSYPHLLHSHEEFSSNETKFDYLACSGATSDDIIKNQIAKLLSDESTYNLITLSAGGNDVSLSDVLNACIFQWSGGNGDQCDDQLNQTYHLINTTLSDNMDSLHTALTPHLSLNGSLFQTGYAKFFDASDAGCDNITWSFWYAQYLGWEQQYLTRERREQMNELVDLTNTIIQDSVERIPLLTNRSDITVKFIDYDPLFGAVKGRFCEPGVQEPEPNRANLLFYEWDTTDDAGEKENGPDGLNPDNSTAGSFEGKIVKWIEEGRKKHSQATMRAHKHPKQDQIDEMSRIIPDGYLRVFHPRPAGHTIVAQKILATLAEHQRNEGTGSSDRPELR